MGAQQIRFRRQLQDGQGIPHNFLVLADEVIE
jgi:hypothetical protein